MFCCVWLHWQGLVPVALRARLCHPLYGVFLHQWLRDMNEQLVLILVPFNPWLTSSLPCILDWIIDLCFNLASTLNKTISLRSANIVSHLGHPLVPSCAAFFCASRRSIGVFEHSRSNLPKMSKVLGILKSGTPDKDVHGISSLFPHSITNSEVR